MGTEAQGRRRALAIVLARNEERRIGGVVAEIREAAKAFPFDVEVAVVDDGSTDGTGRAAAAAGARVLRHPVNLRIGAAEQTGVMLAIREGFDAAVRLDGDGQHPAEGICPLVEAVTTGGADMAVGSRFIRRGEGYTSTPARLVGISLLTGLMRVCSGARVTDPTSGFRAFGPRAMRLIASLPASDYPEPETVIDARRAGLAHVEVPLAFRARTEGVSSIGPIRAVYYMAKITIAVLVASVRERERSG